MNNLSEDLRTLILNYEEPFLIRNILKWSILEWNLIDWSLLLNDEKLDFRSGKYENTKKPQWERDTKIVMESFKEFCSLNVKEKKRWLYFDYKYLKECLKNKPELHNSISWEKFGFPEYNSEDSTLWIGSEGAHTSCHKDTYGCNLVAQIYGKKRWLIFPPKENLFSTRIPYEESSIYSKLNFFSPDKIENFAGIKTCKSIILEPGDVLFIPNNWWHYVENLETAIAINTWIPLSTDPEKQLQESLVQMFVSQIIKNMDNNLQETILNPNMEKLNLQTQDISKSIDVINTCKENCQNQISRSICIFESLFEKYTSNLIKIPTLPTDDFIKLIQQQANRFGNENLEEIDNPDFKNDYEDVINAFLNEDVINLVAEKLLNNNK